jgi:chemotaxis protein MotB
MASDPVTGQNNGVNTDGRGKPVAPVSPPPYSPFHILPKVGGPFWLLTFLDVISLLLAFFIMLFAMSNPRTAAWDELSATFADRLAPDVETLKPAPPTALTVDEDKVAPGLNLDYLVSLLRGHLDSDPLLARTVLHRFPDRLILSMPSDLLFALNSAALNDQARRALFELGGLLGNLSNRMDVHGHTDPAPIRSGPYRGNWELSVARAQSVATELLESGYDKPMIVQGFADTRFVFLARDITSPQREALARRVDIVLYPSQAAILP